MSQEDVATVQGGYDAFNRADIPAVLEVFDDQIEWTEPGGGKAPRGTFRGASSVANDVFATVPENFDEFQARYDRIIDAGDGRLAVVGRFSGRSKAGQTLETSFVHLWQMRNGKAIRFENIVEAEPWSRAWGA